MAESQGTRKGLKIRSLLPLVSGLTLVGLLYAVFAPKRVEIETSVARRGRFEEVIPSDGRLRSKDIRLVTAFADGRLGRVGIRPGDPVKKGQKITSLYWDYDMPVLSPIDGSVSKVFRESAGPIARAEPIFEVVNPRRLEIVLELLTSDAVRAREGDPMRVEISGDQAPLQAEVARISKTGFIKRSPLGVEEERTEVIGEPVEVDSDTLDRLGHNFHVEAEIIVSSQENALMIPIGAVFRDGSNWAVYLIENGRARKTHVQVAARGLEQVAITGGLSDGDIVVMYPGDLVSDGVRVRSSRDRM